MSDSGSPAVLIPGTELFAILREAFERDPDAIVALTTSGLSMYPMLRDRKDVVYLAMLKTPPKKYDVVLFQRKSGAYVLHRVVDVESDGTCVFCGDNQTVLERIDDPNQLVAIVQSFRRGRLKIDCQRSVFFWLYSRIWAKTRFWRRIARGYKRGITSAIKRVLTGKNTSTRTKDSS